MIEGIRAHLQSNEDILTSAGSPVHTAYASLSDDAGAAYQKVLVDFFLLASTSALISNGRGVGQAGGSVVYHLRGIMHEALNNNNSLSIYNLCGGEATEMYQTYLMNRVELSGPVMWDAESN